MSICQDGMDSKLKGGNVSVFIPSNQALILIANVLPWLQMTNLIMRDLKKTEKGFWWLGRRLQLRIHLAIFILQARFQMTDREIEEHLKYNAVYQIFCGKQIVTNWHVPDHSAIVKFRNRLSPETQRQILLIVVKTAESLGFAVASNFRCPTAINMIKVMEKGNGNVNEDAYVNYQIRGKII